MKKLMLAVVASSLLAGCSLLGSDPKPPSKLEESIYKVETNIVPFIVLKTNITTITIPQYVTNSIGITIPQYVTNSVGVMVTNTVTLTQTNVVTQTNLIPQYTYTTSESTKTLTTGVGTLVNDVFPGAGSATASGILALLAIWGHMRSSKSKDTSVSLAQELETVREFIKTLPSGTKYDAAITQFLQSHQVEEGVATQVLALLGNQVSNADAKSAVAEIHDTLATLTKP